MSIATRIRRIAEFNETHLFVVARNKVACIEFPSGVMVWEAVTRSSYNQTIFLMKERIVIGGNGTVEALSYTGEALWHNGMTGKGFGLVVVGTPGKTPWSASPDD